LLQAVISQVLLKRKGDTNGGAVTPGAASNGFGGGGGSGYKDTTAINTAGQSGLSYVTATVGGVTATHTVGISFTNSSISGLPITKSTPVTSADTSSTVAERLASLISADTSLSGVGITASSSGAVITVVQQGWYAQQSPFGTSTTVAVTSDNPDWPAV
jgi:phage tail sheath gpL-like